MKQISVFVTALAIAMIFVLGSGIYNMAATEKHWPITEIVIEWMRENSIAAHTKDLPVPVLEGDELLKSGAEHYHAMCTGCHLAPDMQPTELSSGLYPQPPVFHQRPPENDPTQKLEYARKYFWVIKNGLKMTGMPAWGLSHDDNEIWATTAFVLKLHGMTPSTYEHFVKPVEGHTHSHDH